MNVFGIVDVAAEDETVEIISNKGTRKGKLVKESFEDKVESHKSSKRAAMGLAKSGKAREGTKLQRAVAIVKGLEGLREDCLKALVTELEIKRGNATIYYNKAMALLDLGEDGSEGEF